MVSQEEFVHVTCECLKPQALRLHFMNFVAQIIQQDEVNVLHECDSLTRTLRLLGAPLVPTFDRQSRNFYDCRIHTLSSVFKPFSVMLNKYML